MHDYFAKAGTEWLKFLPKPRRHVFDRRIVEPGDFVEIRMVEALNERLHGRSNLRVVIKPAGHRIDLAFHGNFDFETVSMHSAAFVAFRRIGQRLGRLESKIFC